jgi:hypothetical protein
MEKFENIALDIGLLTTQYNQLAAAFFRDQLVAELKNNSSELVYATKDIGGESLFTIYIDIGDNRYKIDLEFLYENNLEVRLPQLELEFISKDVRHLVYKVFQELLSHTQSIDINS